MSDYVSECLAKASKHREGLYEMRGFVRSALSRVHVVGDNDFVPRWVLVEIQRMINETLDTKELP